MTEAEWKTASEPTPLLEYLGGMANDRKLRLFACACCRRHRHLLIDDRSRAAVDVAERLADGSTTEPERNAAGLDAGNATKAAVAARNTDYRIGEHFQIAARAASFAVTGDTFDVDRSRTIAGCCRLIALHESGGQGRRASENAALCSTLRDIFGNPFRPVAADPSWLTPSVRALAARIYEERDFDRLQNLANVLEVAGCECAEILDHCRTDGPHVRGCWALDLVLGKS